MRVVRHLELELIGGRRLACQTLRQRLLFRSEHAILEVAPADRDLGYLSISRFSLKDRPLSGILVREKLGPRVLVWRRLLVFQLFKGADSNSNSKMGANLHVDRPSRDARACRRVHASFHSVAGRDGCD